MLADAADVEFCGLMLLAMLSLNGVLKRCFGSNGLMLSSDTFLFMLLPCLGLSSPPPTLILKLGGYFWACPNHKTKSVLRWSISY